MNTGVKMQEQDVRCYEPMLIVKDYNLMFFCDAVTGNVRSFTGAIAVHHTPTDKHFIKKLLRERYGFNRWDLCLSLNITFLLEFSVLLQHMGNYTSIYVLLVLFTTYHYK